MTAQVPLENKAITNSSGRLLVFHGDGSGCCAANADGELLSGSAARLHAERRFARLGIYLWCERASPSVSERSRALARTAGNGH